MCRHTISSLAKRLPLVYIREGGELLLNSDDEIHYQKWNSTQLAGKVRIIQYIAGRKSAKKKNSLLIKAVEAANFPQDRFQPTTIVNTDDAIFGTGYFVVGKIEKINAAIRGRNSLLTAMDRTRCLALAGAEFNHSGAE